MRIQKLRGSQTCFQSFKNRLGHAKKKMVYLYCHIDKRLIPDFSSRNAHPFSLKCTLVSSISPKRSNLARNCFLVNVSGILPTYTILRSSCKQTRIQDMYWRCRSKLRIRAVQNCLKALAPDLALNCT